MVMRIQAIPMVPEVPKAMVMIIQAIPMVPKVPKAMVMVMMMEAILRKIWILILTNMCKQVPPT